MARLLFVVEDKVSIEGRDGTFLAPGYPARLKVAADASIELRRPDGSRLATTIKGILFCSPNPKHIVPILIHVPQDQVPVGTEVWLSDAKILFETDRLKIEHEFEVARLIDKETGQTLMTDDFCGDPKCALIDSDNRWALIGGEHLTVWRNGQVSRIDNVKWVHSLRKKGEDAAEILTDPWGEAPAIWQMDMPTGTIRKVRDFDDYRDKEYTEDVIW